jgi:hypothetical protein
MEPVALILFIGMTVGLVAGAVRLWEVRWLRIPNPK